MSKRIIKNISKRKHVVVNPKPRALTATAQLLLSEKIAVLNSQAMPGAVCRIRLLGEEVSGKLMSISWQRNALGVLNEAHGRFIYLASHMRNPQTILLDLTTMLQDVTWIV